MGRSKSKKRKAARRDFSNRRLPTFDTFDRELDRMVGLPDFSPIEPAITEFRIPNFVYAAQEILSSGLPVPEPTESVPMSKALWQPQDVIQEVKAKPEPIDTCVARTQRTEVIHATGRAGKRGQKSPIWTEKSKIKC